MSQVDAEPLQKKKSLRCVALAVLFLGAYMLSQGIVLMAVGEVNFSWQGEWWTIFVFWAGICATIVGAIDYAKS